MPQPESEDPGKKSRRAAPPAPARRPQRDAVATASLAVLLVATGLLYLWGLDASGYANSFYSAAAQAGSQSWSAWFFGSLDPANAITVDKPPAALWVMGLSVRLFGLSSWSILVPEALMGVSTVAVVYATVRRVLTHGDVGAARPLSPRSAHWAALVAALTTAVTPVAVLMFRFNNPDALLVLLVTTATCLTLRAVQDGRRRWLVLAGVAIGFAFLTKMLQAFVVLPVLVLAYAVGANLPWRRKLLDLLAAFGALLVSAGWYVTIVESMPAHLRPYVGGTQTNSFLELVLGYNGLGRITGTEVGSVGGGQRGPGAGEQGWWRLFSGVSGGMVSWLIPAALLLTVVAVVLLVRRAGPVGTDGRRRERVILAGLIAFAGTLVLTGVVFSLMEGIYHDYYTVALAPAIGGTVGLAGAVAWAHRGYLFARLGLAAATLATAGWAFVLLRQASGLYATLGWAVVAAGVVAAGALLVSSRLPQTLAAAALAGAVAVGTAGPTAYALDTAATPHTGSIVTAGPVTGGGVGGPGGSPAQGGVRGQPPNGQPQAGQGPGRDGTFRGAPGPNTGSGATPGTAAAPPGGSASSGPGDGGGAGGLLNGARVSSELVALLQADAGSHTWAAASVGAQNAASYQLASGQAVMAIGGFNGSDPSPTLARLQQLVAEGRIHYFLGDDLTGRQNGGSEAASEIAAWVSQTFPAATVGSTTVYDLTGGAR